MTYLFYTANSFNSILTIDGGKNSIVQISKEKNLNNIGLKSIFAIQICKIRIQNTYKKTGFLKTLPLRRG